MPSVSNQSYITLPSKTVIDACEKTIQHIIKERSKRDAEWLAKNRGYLRKHSFFGLFSFGPIIRPLTDEEVYENSSLECIFESHSCYGWGTLDTAEKLLNAAKMTSEIHVTAQDWESVS